jgi:hypothetical protein
MFIERDLNIEGLSKKSILFHLLVVRSSVRLAKQVADLCLAEYVSLDR